MAPVLRHCPCLRPENDDVRLLDYSHSNLDDVPNEVFGFERTLEELSLDANQIKDLPRPLFHCHGLRKLNLSDNEIQTLPPAIASLINLEQLDISKNGVLEIPDNIKGCKCLMVIDASVNPLGKLPEGFTYLINLQELYLNDTFLEYLPANFGRLSRLKILELRENHLKLLPKSMARLTELSRLDIGQNDFSDLPEVIGNLPRLGELWCDNNNLNCLPPFLGGLKKLAYLDASKNKIYEVADEIEGCINVCDLTLSSNRIKVLPDGIANLRKLSVLRVDENRITSVPENIGNLCNLEELVLSSNNLKSLPPSIGLCRNLRTLIADDNLMEDLPCEIGSCMKLTIVSLRDNKLVQIPDELGHITALKVINLSGNLLQYLPFSIAKLPNLQALWLSENQNKPLIPLQSDTDRITRQKVLTCFMLPQVPLDEEVIEVEEVEVQDSVKNKQIIKFAFDAEKDQPSRLVRAPTPYPKELKAHARHARNYALKKQGSKESDASEIPNDITQIANKVEGLHATGATPDIMILPSGPPQESNSMVKEAIVSKPKSPLSSPPRHERHYIQSVKDPVSNEIVEMKQHSFLEQNPLQLSHQANTDLPGSDITPKVLGRRDSRGDGSSSENTSTSATGSPKSTPDVVMAESYNHPQKIEKEGHFRKNIPATTGKRDTWMRQRLLRQGSGDSDRGYRSDHEVYIAEKDQYGQSYHDGYASDWEAFLAKQNYPTPANAEALQTQQQYIRTIPYSDVEYRGLAEGQDVKDGERDIYAYQWDPRFRYPPSDGSVVDEEYQARMTPPYEGYWQMDPSSGQIYGAYDMSHSYPPGTDNPAYVYARNQHGDVPPPMAAQPYYDDDGYKHPSPQFWMQRMPNPNTGVVNNPGTLPRRLSAASPRMKRAQCLSVQAPLHSNPQEYHLMPHQTGTLRPALPNNPPRPGRSPSPGVDNRVQYSPQPYPKFPPHFQPQYSAQGYPITTQPMNTVHFPPPMPNVHPAYHGNFPESQPMYPTLPVSPRMKQVAQPYVMSTLDDSALLTRQPFTHVFAQPSVHSSNYYSGPEGQHVDPYSQNPTNSDGFTKVQDAEYGAAQATAALQYRSGSIPAHIQNLENCDINDVQHLHKSVPSINIIPSTSPPHTAYMASTENRRDMLDQKQDRSSNHESKPVVSDVQNSVDINAKTNNNLDTSEATEALSEEVCNKVDENKTESSSIKNNSAHSNISSQDSFVVISPKPSKIINPHGTPNISLPVNKDVTVPISSENQTAFRKPGCFQAVPITIPGVHASVHKKELSEKETGGQPSSHEEVQQAKEQKCLYANDHTSLYANDLQVQYANDQSVSNQKSHYANTQENQYVNNQKSQYANDQKGQLVNAPKDQFTNDKKSQFTNDQKGQYVNDLKNHYANNQTVQHPNDQNIPCTNDLKIYTNDKVLYANNQKYQFNDNKNMYANDQVVQLTANQQEFANDQKILYANDQKVQYTNVAECNRQVFFSKQPSSTCSEQNDESNSKFKVTSTNQGAKHPGVIGDMISNINNASKVEQNATKGQYKSHASNVQTNYVPQPTKKLDNTQGVKPGFPVKISNNQNPSLPEDIPPDLPKKEKNSKTAQTPTDSNKITANHPSHSQTQETPKNVASKNASKFSIPNQNQSKQGSSSILEQSKALQNKILMENSKNVKKDSDMNRNRNQNKQETPNTDMPDSNKLCSSDKRFQKVLPPLDSSFALKPCSARKSYHEGITSDNIIESQKGQNNPNPGKRRESMPPSVPPKTAVHSSSSHHYENRTSSEPPLIPPKKSMSAKNLLPVQTPKENASNKEKIVTKTEPEEKAPPVPLHANQKRVLKREDSVSKPNVDVVEVKEVNNEKNVQLQKGNMPDLISKIIPNEKNELILKEESNVEKNGSNEKDVFNNRTSKDIISGNAPESPKSQRQSWFFGTHKNSLVFPVTILKNPELGFSIEGGIGSPRNPAKPHDNGIYVAQVSAEGPASSLLKPGDKILQVDGTDFTQLDRNKAAALLQESGTTISLMISRE